MLSGCCLEIVFRVREVMSNERLCLMEVIVGAISSKTDFIAEGTVI